MAMDALPWLLVLLLTLALAAPRAAAAPAGPRQAASATLQAANGGRALLGAGAGRAGGVPGVVSPLDALQGLLPHYHWDSGACSCCLCDCTRLGNSWPAVGGRSASVTGDRRKKKEEKEERRSRRGIEYCTGRQTREHKISAVIAGCASFLS